MNKSFSEKHQIKKFDEIVLMCNGCFSLVLAVTIFLTNILLVMATRRNPLRFNKVIDKINIASFYLNLVACVFFLPYFGITVILQSLQITKTTVLFPSNPSYLCNSSSIHAVKRGCGPPKDDWAKLSVYISSFSSPFYDQKQSANHFVAIRVLCPDICLFAAYWNKQNRILHRLYPYVYFSPYVCYVYFG